MSSDDLRKKRRLNCPKLVIGDGHLGIWGVLANVYPAAQEQRSPWPGLFVREVRG